MISNSIIPRIGLWTVVHKSPSDRVAVLLQKQYSNMNTTIPFYISNNNSCK